MADPAVDKAAARAEANLPREDGDAPLHELTRDQLSVFLYLAFTDSELGQLCGSMKIHVPGFRTEKMSGVQKADLVADEVRARPDAKGSVLELLRKIYEFPGLDDVTLAAPVAERIAMLSEMEDFRVLVLWRLLADPQADVRKAVLPTLDALSKAFYGGTAPAPANAPEPAKGPRPAEKAQPPDDAELKKELARAKELAEKAEARAESLGQQLKAARQAEAEAGRELSKERKARERGEDERKALEAELEKAKARAKGAPSEKHTRQIAHLDEQVQALKAERAELQRALEAARATQAPSPTAPEAPAQAPAEDEPTEEAPAGWAMPRFTPEFYDSLSRWDVRIQRAAFKQAYLLAENYRHPSLRALPLQGLEGYYRVRVATDVRLIYRRDEKGTVEILSLIDREDLDRYVRQAKTR